MGGVINLKKCSMVFKNKGTCVIVPLDPAEVMRYTEPAYEKEELDHIYKIIAQDEDRVNPTDEGMLCWEKDMNVFPTSMKSWRIGKVGCMRFQRCEGFGPSRISVAFLPQKEPRPTKRTHVKISSLMNQRVRWTVGQKHYR